MIAGPKKVTYGPVLDVLKNIPRGQFVRLRCKIGPKIDVNCSRKSDYLLNSEILWKKLIERGFHEKELKKTTKQVTIIG